MVPAADACDECALRDTAGRTRDGVLKFLDRECALDGTHLVARVHASARVVHVRIEQTRDDGAASQIHDHQVSRRPWVGTDGRDAAVPDGHRRNRVAATVDELAVRQDQIASSGAHHAVPGGSLRRRVEPGFAGAPEDDAAKSQRTRLHHVASVQTAGCRHRVVHRSPRAARSFSAAAAGSRISPLSGTHDGYTANGFRSRMPSMISTTPSASA